MDDKYELDRFKFLFGGQSKCIDMPSGHVNFDVITPCSLCLQFAAASGGNLWLYLFPWTTCLPDNRFTEFVIR